MTETKTVEVTLSKQLSAATDLYACFCIACGQPDEESLHDPERCAGQGRANDAFPISDALAAYDRSCEEEPDLEDDARALHCAIIAAKMVLASQSLSTDEEVRRLREEVRIWKGEAERRSEGMVRLNLDRAAMGVENMRLREALAPFADAGEYLDLETDGFIGGEKIAIFYNDHELFDGLKFSDFIRARAALQSKDTPSHGG